MSSVPSDIIQKKKQKKKRNKTKQKKNSEVEFKLYIASLLVDFIVKGVERISPGIISVKYTYIIHKEEGGG